MATKPAYAVAAAALASLAFSAPAQAELQTWRLTATSSSVQEGLTAPSFAELGKSFTIDYVIDTLQPSMSDWPGLFYDSIKSFTINGVKSSAGGYIAAFGGNNAISTWPNVARSDGIEVILFESLIPRAHANVSSALQEFATSQSTALRLDFAGQKSIRATPVSFVMISVPEPSAAWLLLAGVPLLAIKRGRRSAAA